MTGRRFSQDSSTLLLTVVSLAVGTVQAASPSVPVLARRLLLCDREETLAPLLSAVDRQGAGYHDDAAILIWGEPQFPDVGIAVRGGLRVGTAVAPAVYISMSGRTSPEGLDALVWAEFAGDYEPLLARYGLRKAAVEHQGLGVYSSDPGAWPAGTPREGKELCAPSLRLTPLARGRFLMGCGWCNG